MGNDFNAHIIGALNNGPHFVELLQLSLVQPVLIKAEVLHLQRGCGFAHFLG